MSPMLRVIRQLAGLDPSATASPADDTDGEYLDALPLRDAILAEDVVLHEPPGGGFVLHHVDGCRARHVGSFADAAAAWRAVDAIDEARAGRRRRSEVP